MSNEALALWIIQHMHVTYTPRGLEYMLEKASQTARDETTDAETVKACRELIKVAHENKYMEFMDNAGEILNC